MAVLLVRVKGEEEERGTALLKCRNRLQTLSFPDADSLTAAQ